MMRQGWFALSDNRFAQAGYVQTGGEGGAETDFANEIERLIFGLHLARGHAAKMEIAMALEAPSTSSPLENAGVDRAPAVRGGRQPLTRSTHSRNIAW